MAQRPEDRREGETETAHVAFLAFLHRFPLGADTPTMQAAWRADWYRRQGAKAKAGKVLVDNTGENTLQYQDLTESDAPLTVAHYFRRWFKNNEWIERWRSVNLKAARDSRRVQATRLAAFRTKVMDVLMDTLEATKTVSAKDAMTAFKILQEDEARHEHMLDQGAVQEQQRAGILDAYRKKLRERKPPDA